MCEHLQNLSGDPGSPGQIQTPVAEFTDPVREVKASFKVGLKGAITHTALNPTLTPL